MDELLTSNFTETFQLIWEIIVDPASKPLEALLIFGIIIIAMIMLLMSVLLFITRHPAEEAGEYDYDDVEHDEDEGEAQQEVAAAPAASRRARRRLPVGLVVLLAIVGWWVATAVTTASTPVCLTCHESSQHARTQSDVDPHERVRCVRCHDNGGPLASLTTAVPSRLEHVATGMLNGSPSGTYGSASGACASCHASDIDVTTENDFKAVKVSHAEPIDAGADCLDCHRLSDGIVGVSTTKMQPCLRCHNGTDAPAECAYCHTGDVALAVSGRSDPTTTTASPLVKDIDCGSCHTQESCDSCHGVRLPHTQEFMAYAHAREGVEDLWYNGGRTCGKCHNDESRPCTSCHLGKFTSHGSDFRSLHQSGTAKGCDTCHSQMAYRNSRDFCGLCHAGSQ